MILVYPSLVQIYGDDLEEIATQVSTYKKTSPGRGGSYVTETHVLFENNELPIGLWHRFLQKAGDKVLDATIDMRPEHTPLSEEDIDPVFGEYTLRDYQIEALVGSSKHRVTIIKSSTGSGKSLLTNATVLLRPLKRWLVLVHKENLLQDLMATYRKMGGDERDMGVIKAGKFSPGRVTFAMSPTLAKHKQADEFLVTVECIVMDECHTAGAPGSYSILKRAVNASWRYGLSATPTGRSDGTNKLVEAQLGHIGVEISTERLMDEERVARFNVYGVKFQHTQNDAVRTAFGYTAAYKKAISNNPDRDLLAIEICRVAKMPAFVFVKSVSQALLLSEKIQKFTGLKVTCVTQKTHVSKRQSIARDLNIGRIDVIVATKVFYDGVDVPWTASVIFLGGGRALIEAIQTIGRGSRRPEGKESCDIWFIADDGWNAFSAQTRARISYIRDEGHSVHMCELVDGKLTIEHTFKPKKRRVTDG